jgi:hypothetical protein
MPSKKKDVPINDRLVYAGVTRGQRLEMEYSLTARGGAEYKLVIHRGTTKTSIVLPSCEIRRLRSTIAGVLENESLMERGLCRATNMYRR